MPTKVTLTNCISSAQTDVTGAIEVASLPLSPTAIPTFAPPLAQTHSIEPFGIPSIPTEMPLSTSDTLFSPFDSFTASYLPPSDISISTNSGSSVCSLSSTSPSKTADTSPPLAPTPSSFTLENCLTAAGVFLAIVFLFIIGLAVQAAISLAAGILIPTAIGFVGLLILSKKFPHVKPVFNWVWEQLQTLRARKRQSETELGLTRRPAVQV